MSATLQEIIGATRRRVAELRSSPQRNTLESQADRHNPRGFRRVLESGTRKGIAVIAELKKASPSRGLIRKDFNPGALAAELALGGAAALSVLTEEQYFLGSLENLQAASEACELPCLRKDFIVDELQLLEARANRADAVLLIVAALSDAELPLLVRRAGEHSLDVLCEVHDEEELRRALDAGCETIGVNNRNLSTFQVDLRTAFRLASLIPGGIMRIAESGIKCGADIARLRGAGYHAFLIGEALMETQSPGEALRSLLIQAQAPVIGSA